MSSSPPSFVPSVASFEAPPPPPSSCNDHGSSSRVSRPPVQGFQDLRIEPGPDADSASSGSKSSMSLNPLAKEFVPGTSSTASEGLLPIGESGDLSVRSSDLSLPVQPSWSDAGSETISRAAFEGSTFREEDRAITEQSKGGLSIAFKRGQTGYSRPLVASKGGSEGASTVAGTGGPGKRGQFLNANHLLNFQYDPIVRPPAARTPFIRRPLKVQPYNKELFLQANFRFLVSDYGDYLVNASDPDKMLEWEDVAAVSVSASHPIQCPICLEAPPVCPQITLCGHIFCFACILRYLAMGEEEQKNDYFKKCPLCFAMTSSRALRTVLIDDVHSYQVGDFVEFTLLNRAKGSIIPFEKSNPVIGTLPYSKDGQCHPFSKFTLTSETEMTANKAIAELSSWAENVQEEGGEEMDLLPFVFAAIDQLQERKVAWGEHRVSEFLSSSPPVRQRIMAQTRERTMHASSPPNDSVISGSTTAVTSKSPVRETQDVAAEMEAAMADLKDRAAWVYEDAFSDDEGGGSKKSKPSKPRGGTSQLQDTAGHAEKTRAVNIPSTWEDISLDEGQAFERTQTVESDKHPLQDINKDSEERESYAFYQALDGQPFILHPLNMKCLLQQYESYDNLPPRLRARIVEMESHIQTEATRKRYRYLSHLPLTTNFWFCELDLRGVLPSSAFAPFIEEIRFREARRRRRLKQEHTERLKEERMNLSQSKNFSPSGRAPLEETEEELLAGPGFDGTSSTVQSTSPVLDQRKLFSQVTKLGFASAHDAPELTLANTTPSQSSAVSVSSQSFGSSPDAGTNRLSPLSFADIIQAQSSKMQNGANGMAASQSSSKKSRKAAKVLLSTAGGRRY